MSIYDLAKNIEKFTVANSPAILTGVAVTGTITAAVLTGKASYKAAQLIAEAEAPRLEQSTLTGEDWELEASEKVQLVWTLYVPAVSVCVTTIVAMIAANQIGSKRTAAMAAAYTISEKAYGEYREKIVEKLGVNKEQTARDEIAQERVDSYPVSEQQVVMLNEREVLCYDQYSGRYFNSDMETIKKAQNDLNYLILRETYANLNDFYDRIGLDTLPVGDDVGWSSNKQMELIFSTVMSRDQRPCIAIDFTVTPVKDYYRAH